jgi:LmbE family N-acetylglucosaminyl deacetylase
MVLAHPDDESMGNGTLIARHVGAGCEVHLVCATRGGAGWTGRPAGRDPSELPEIREGELARAAEVLGLAGVELWDYPDGGVSREDQAEIVRRIQEAVERLQPDAVVGWGPDGGYGHHDHIAMGACTDRALAGTGRPHYHMAVDKLAADAYDRLTRRHAVDVGDMHLAGLSHVDVILEPSEAELDTVRRAIECHDSQRNQLVALLLSDPHLLFWMARSCYLRQNGSLTPPATELLPEFSSPRLGGS